MLLEATGGLDYKDNQIPRELPKPTSSITYLNLEAATTPHDVLFGHSRLVGYLATNSLPAVHDTSLLIKFPPKKESCVLVHNLYVYILVYVHTRIPREREVIV